MSKALDAIHDEAVKLLHANVSDEVRNGLELIRSLAQHKFDVRSEGEGRPR